MCALQSVSDQFKLEEFVRSCNSTECALLLVIELHGCLLLATAASAAAECETESFGKLRPSPIIFGGELADLELDLEFGAPLLFQCNRILLRKFHPIYLFSEFLQLADLSGGVQ